MGDFSGFIPEGGVVQIPGAKIKEFLLTILGQPRPAI
jgi:hypothetical protein